MPLEDFLNQVMKNVVGVLANNIGWHAAQTTAVDILADLAKRYLLQLAKGTHNYAEHFGRTSANLNDASLALRDMGVNISELEEYIQNFDPVLLSYSHKVPEIPVKKESKLNFLRPGSEEVLTRPMHVHEYMPPMIFEKKELKKEDEEAKEDGEIGESDDQGEMMDVSNNATNGEAAVKVEENETVREPSPEKESHFNGSSEVSLSNGMSNMEVDHDKDESSEDEIEALENGGTSSRKFTPFSGLSKSNKRENASENPALKRIRMMLEEEGHPLREITSAMMTSSGFLSSSREGRLPDSRPPPIPREFFEPLPPPPLDKKKKVITMKRIVEGVKKIDKEKENDTEDGDEPGLFGNPDKIKTPANNNKPLSSATADLKPSKELFAVGANDIAKGEVDPKKLKKLKKLKLDKKKMSKGLDRDKKKLKIFKKAQQMKAAADKALLKKSKKFQLKEFTKSSIKNKVPLTHPVQESLDMIDSDDDFDMGIHDNHTPVRPQPTVAPMIIKSSAVTKKKEFSPIPDMLKVSSKGKESKSVSPSSGLSPHLVSTPKTSPLLEGGLPSKKVSPLSLTSTPTISPDGQLKKKRGRPRKNTPLVLTPAALANLGRGLMQEKRQLKIKKSHMEPDVRSLIPEISISTPAPPPKANRPPPNLNLLPAAPGLIPTGFGNSPVKMPPHIPPSISITPATPSIPISPVKDKNPFGGSSSSSLHHTNVCSSITITPIDMPNSQKLPTPYDKTVTPGIGSPSMQQQSRPNKPAKEKPSPPSMQMPIKGSGGLTITPIVMKDDRFANEVIVDSKLPQNNLAKIDHKSSPLSGMKLDDDLKTKEQRRKEKERRKELKKEKKKEKKEKEKLKEGKVKEEGKEKKDKKDKSEKKKEKKKDKLVAESGAVISSPPYGATVPKLTLKLSGHSGTPTPVDSPNPPPVTIDYEPKVVPTKVLPPPPPLTPAPKKIVFKPIEEQAKLRTPSPELARFSPLVTRAPKPGRAAKAHAAAAVAAEAMGALMGHQMVSFPPDNLGTPGSSKRGRKSGPSGGKTEKPEKAPKTPKAAPTVTTLVTETVGWFEDEHGNKIWICPSCGRQDDGSPMIGCDICDDWYHFVCVGITETPAEDSHWFCPRCEKKKHKKDRKK